MKLISCTDYVIEIYEKVATNMDAQSAYLSYVQYALFLKRTLELGMFIPCDKEGNVMSLPLKPTNGCNMAKYYKRKNEYQEAKDRVLFEGCKMEGRMYKSTRQEFYRINGLTIYQVDFQHNGDIKRNFRLKKLTVESLITNDLTLTETAVKQLT